MLIMERKIGDTFEYQGKKLIVEENKSDNCVGCFFNGQCPLIVRQTAGECQAESRVDNKYVIFVEVKEQHETKAVKERKIGEIFNYDGKTLEVVETKSDTCYNCYFKEKTGRCSRIKSKTGVCDIIKRSDRRPVIFVEVKDKTKEQPHEKPQQKLNLCEILKNCSMGEPFWSPLYGDVKLYCIDQEEEKVVVTAVGNVHRNINANGTATIYGVTSEEIMLYPSREQRDWSKVKYEPKHVLPRSWEEFCVTHDITMSEYFIDETGNIFNPNSGKRIPEISKTILPSEQAAEAHLAYMQLHQLRNAWREGWTPDWTDNTQAKFAIIYNKDEHIVFDCRFMNRFLSFQDESRAKEFLECYKGLIKKAGDLI